MPGAERDVARVRVRMGRSPVLLSRGTRAAPVLQRLDNKQHKTMVVGAGLDKMSVFEVSPQSIAQIPMDVSGIVGDVPGLTGKDTGFPSVPQLMSKTSQRSCR